MARQQQQNLSAVLKEKLTISVEDVPPLGEALAEGQVRVRMGSVGICGSDVHYWQHMRIGDTFVVRQPMILGHESSGTVVQVGSRVSHLKIGDRVALEPGVPCKNCQICRSGRYNLCDKMAFLATPPVDGSLRQFHVHDASFCYKLPDHVSLEEGAMLEPLSVAVHACSRAGISTGDSVLVTGAGPIGLVNIMVAKASGATHVTCTDIDDNRLKVARSIGADDVINVKGLSRGEVIDRLQGQRPNKAIECSGVQSSVQLAIHACSPGGCVVVVGLGPKDEIEVPLITMAVKEVDVRGVFRYANCYPKALALVASGKVDVKPLITDRFTLKETTKAFETALKGTAIKIIIDCQ